MPTEEISKIYRSQLVTPPFRPHGTDYSSEPGAHFRVAVKWKIGKVIDTAQRDTRLDRKEIDLLLRLCEIWYGKRVLQESITVFRAFPKEKDGLPLITNEKQYTKSWGTLIRIAREEEKRGKSRKSLKPYRWAKWARGRNFLDVDGTLSVAVELGIPGQPEIAYGLFLKRTKEARRVEFLNEEEAKVAQHGTEITLRSIDDFEFADGTRFASPQSRGALGDC